MLSILRLNSFCYVQRLPTEGSSHSLSVSWDLFESFTGVVPMRLPATLYAAEPTLRTEKSDGDRSSTYRFWVGRCVVPKISSRLEKPEKEVQGTWESVRCRQTNFASGVLIYLEASLLNVLATFIELMKEFIASTAERAIGRLPDDMHKSIWEQGDRTFFTERARNQCTDPDVTGNEWSAWQIARQVTLGAKWQCSMTRPANNIALLIG